MRARLGGVTTAVTVPGGASRIVTTLPQHAQSSPACTIIRGPLPANAIACSGSGDVRMEIADVRKQVKAALDRAKRAAADRRAQTDEAARAYETFLERIAVPIFRQVENVLRVERHPFKTFT